MNHFPSKPVFLSAEWRNLLNFTYRIPAEALASLLPPELEIDWWEDHAHVSLVAFDFLQTKVKGIPIPFHINFPEINLRAYVKKGNRNGVIFVKELVPKHAIAWTAKLFYNEPYERRKMTSSASGDEDSGLIHHDTWFGSEKFTIDAKIGKSQGFPEKGTPDYFFKEHDLGYGVRRNGNVLCYRVDHPEWEVREIESFQINWDFGLAYGKEWAFLNELEPTYKLCAVGSPVKVYHPFPLAGLQSE